MELHRTPIGLGALVVLATLVASTRAQQAPTPAGDPTGFVQMLNAARAGRGLPPVAYDPDAAEIAAQNNRVQATSGLGHHVVGSYGQVAAVGMLDAASALRAWSESPAHAALIYAPDLAAIGYHQRGGCCTASTRQGYPAFPPATAPPAPAYVVPPPPIIWTYPAQPVRWIRIR